MRRARSIAPRPRRTRARSTTEPPGGDDRSHPSHVGARAPVRAPLSGARCATPLVARHVDLACGVPHPGPSMRPSSGCTTDRASRSCRCLNVIAAETGGSMRYSSAVDHLELAATDELGDRPAVARQQHPRGGRGGGAGPGLRVNEVITSVGQQAELGRAVLEPDRLARSSLSRRGHRARDQDEGRSSRGPIRQMMKACS